METLTPHLHASAPYDLGFGRVPLMARAYLLQREGGNLLLYGAQAIEPELEAVRRLGGVRRQYLNHSHEASPAADRVGEAFGAPLLVHARDAAETAERATVGETFTERHLVGDDFEVIPVPGHTEGATVYLWRGDGHDVLFTGDTIYIRRGEWVAAVLDGISDRERYIESLELIRDLDFDLLQKGAGSVSQLPSDRPGGARALRPAARHRPDRPAPLRRRRARRGRAPDRRDHRAPEGGEGPVSDARPGRVVHLPVTEVIACSLDAGGLADQLGGWEDLRARHLRAREPVPSGVRLRLAPEAAERARELAAREAACCGFLRIEVETGPETLVTITGPEAAREAIAALAGEAA